MGESGLQEVLGLAAGLKESGLFTDAELAALRSELKRLVVLQVQGLIAEITAQPKSAPAAAAAPNEHAERIRQQLRKVASALK
jgi:hypothetical protein